MVTWLEKRLFSYAAVYGSLAPKDDEINVKKRGGKLHFFYFYFDPPADGKKSSLSSPNFHVLPYASCVDLTQLLAQPNASWRPLRIPL